MQTKAIYALIVSAAALTSVGAHADNTPVWGFDLIANTPSTVSTTTREAVKKELLQAQRQGFTTATNVRDYPAEPSDGVKTRDQLRSEVQQARAKGSNDNDQR